ncbi:MAG: hypothetical protein KDD69_13815 [Bdellovibrionales bacterium]|nr:hypothetical protein [Bdellovibrionales bacterium]
MGRKIERRQEQRKSFGLAVAGRLLLPIAILVCVTVGFRGTRSPEPESGQRQGAEASNRPMHRQKAQVIFDSGEQQCSRTAVVLKSFHSGSTGVGMFLKRPEVFRMYLRHQMESYLTLRERYEALGAARFRCIAEGFTDESEVDQVAALMQQLRPLHQTLQQAVSEGPAADQALGKMLSVLRAGGEGALRTCSGNALFLAYLGQQPNSRPSSVFLPGDPKNYRPLVADAMNRFRQLAAVEDSNLDEAAEGFLRWQKEAITRDFQVRHDFLHQSIKKVGEGTTVFIVIGGDHAAKGARLTSDGSGNALEDALREIVGCRVQVLEDPHFVELIEAQRTADFILSTDTTVEELKALLAAIKARQ